MSWWQALILGLVQGLTEFLPVSSSGHLAILQRMMGLTIDGQGLLFFDTLMHVGTLLAVITVFWADARGLIVNFFVSLKHPSRLVSSCRPGGLNRRLWLLILASIPATILAVVLGDKLDNLLPGKWLAVGFWATALILSIGEVFARHQPSRPIPLDEMTAGDALIIGAAQGAALFPGVSRSGSTITAGRLRGIARSDVARFSLWMSAVAILGGALVQLPDVIQGGIGGIGASAIIAGFLASAVSGFLAIVWLLRALKEGKFYWFAIYVALIGVLVYWGAIG
nr:undecaprenyl-diphosphate phosphatase [bacterium]